MCVRSLKFDDYCERKDSNKDWIGGRDAAINKMAEKGLTEEGMVSRALKDEKSPAMMWRGPLQV